MNKKSMRTTLAGIATILGAISQALTALSDGDPATNPDWLLIGTALATGWGLLCARDHKVSSEDAGIK